jgi:gliding motility-associated-like protein
MMKARLLSVCTLLGLALALGAQPQDGLVAYYSFNNCDAREDLGTGADGIIMGTAACGCGVSGNGLRLDGNTTVQILGDFDVLFTADFTISFFMQPDPSSNAIADVMSKSEICGVDSTFEMRYNPVTREISLSLSQQPNLFVRSTNQLPADRCYHHIAFVRRDRELLMYYDGVQQSLDPSSALVRIINNGILTLAGGPCLANGEVSFRGTLDELRFYNRALTSSEVAELYIPVDRVTSPDTVLFTGTSMQVRLPGTCATNIFWTPTAGVSNPGIAEPVLSPAMTTIYGVEMDYGHCQAFDSLKVTVADSADLACDNVFFPNAFTPNADGLNDVWGMSNIVFLGEFVELIVYDRWGGEVFRTQDRLSLWDGRKDGKDVDPGIFAFAFKYRCNEEERLLTGSFQMLR